VRSVDDGDRLFPHAQLRRLLVVPPTLMGIGLMYGIADGLASGSFARIGAYLGVSLLFTVMFVVVAAITIYLGRRSIARERERTRAFRDALKAAHHLTLDTSDLNPQRTVPARHG